ncbi:MAG: hypothetical protein Q4D95_04485 [Peptoniphilus sp.]|nr:hypothetical protein [Peptoniphilus sp.]
MKKILFLVLVLTFIVAGTNYTFAAAEEKNDENLLRVKKIFDISEDFDKFDISSSTNKNGFKTISYSWHNKDENINVTTDAKGNIIDYFNYYNEGERKLVLKDKKEIEQRAEDYLKKIDPALLNKYKLQDLYINVSSPRAELSYNRVVNGLDVKNDTISMTINLSTKTLSEYSRTYSSPLFTDDKFPSKDKAISKDEAIKIILKDNPLYLSYFLKYTDSDDVEYVPAYVQLKKSLNLDAVSSEFITDPTYNVLYGDEGSMKKGAETAADEAGLTPTEQKEVDKIKGVKSPDDAKKFLQDNFDLKDMKFDYLSLDKIDKDTYVYDISYYSDAGSAHFGIGAKDFKLYNYHYYEMTYNSDDKKPAPSDKEAIEISKAFVKKFNKDSDLDLSNPVVQVGEDNEPTTVSFFVKKNGHYVVSKGVTTSVGSNKKISSYRLNDVKVKLSPMDKDVIDIKKAESIAKDNLELYYAYVGDKPRLIYSFFPNERPVIRAKDGVLLNSNGDVDTKGEIIYEDIDQSKYKDELNLLKSLNIGFPKTMKVGDPISIGDYAYILSSLSSPYITYDQKTLKNYARWIYEDMDPNDLSPNLTKKDAVKWIVNREGFKDLKKVKDVFDKNAFTDSDKIPAEYRAYYYLAKGLSIYDLDEAAPDADISVEEAMHLIYNSIFN